MSRIYHILMFSVLVSSGCIAEKVSSPEQDINESLLEVAASEPEVASVIGENPAYDVTVLAPEKKVLRYFRTAGVSLQ